MNIRVNFKLLHFQTWKIYHAAVGVISQIRKEANYSCRVPTRPQDQSLNLLYGRGAQLATHMAATLTNNLSMAIDKLG